MNRDHCIIMYDTSDIAGDWKIIRCFACIGREHIHNLCIDGYLVHINPDYTFRCGVNGYNKEAIRRNAIEHFDNTKHKIIMTTNQCFLCDKQCKYPDMQCKKIRKTVGKYKEVVGIV